jgi:hypothetical protein
LPPAVGATPLVEKLVLGLQGERAAISELDTDPVEFRLGRLAWFLGTGAAGKGLDQANSRTKWQVELPGDEGGRVPSAVALYEWTSDVSLAGRRSALVTFSLNETKLDHPMTARGTFHIDRDTGIVVVAKVRAHNALLPGGNGDRFDLTIESLTELHLKTR